MSQRTRDPSETPPSDTALKIAQLEYTLLSDARRISFDGAGRRFDSYLVLSSIAAVALGTVVNMDADQNLKDVLLAIVTTTAALLGFATFGRLVELRLNAVLYTRGLNRLRGWFLAQSPELSSFFVLPANDDRPTFLGAAAFVSKSAVVAIINAVLMGAASGLAFTAEREQTFDVDVGLVTFAACLLGQVSYLIGRSLITSEKYIRNVSDLGPSETLATDERREPPGSPKSP